MTNKQAAALKVGDKVTTKNGVYLQHGTVVRVEGNSIIGYWINYEWVTLLKRNYGCKRPKSVHLGWMIWNNGQWIPL